MSKIGALNLQNKGYNICEPWGDTVSLDTHYVQNICEPWGETASLDTRRTCTELYRYILR